MRDGGAQRGRAPPVVWERSRPDALTPSQEGYLFNFMDRESGVPTVPAEDLREELERLRLLHAIGQEFSASLDFDELLPKVFDTVLRAVGAQGGSIWIAED